MDNNERNPKDNGSKTHKPQFDFKKDFIARVKGIKTSRWIRFAIVSLLFFLWVIWMGNPWLSLLWLLLVDIYITAYIPWGWWKNKGKGTRKVMSWVDAIVYALVLVYFIFAFVGQNYNIPSSSLEKSLLVGDYLWVNKTLYGPRVPQTPIHFPLTQNTMPIVNTKSYLEHPQLSYHRLPGIRSIERGDIVVFNYPQGDTVCLKQQNPDYYMEINRLQRQGVENPREYIRSNQNVYGEVVYRPVDRRENYVKRAIGLPGEYIEIKNNDIYINGKKIAEPTNVQYNYIVQTDYAIPEDVWIDMGVRLEDRQPINGEDGIYYYNVPLTKEMKKRVESLPQVIAPLVAELEAVSIDELNDIFPVNSGYGWRRDNMGKFWIPERGSVIHLTLNNLPLYERAIRVYEGNDLQVKDGKIYINGEQTDYYMFKMDYYWMMGDNRDRSLDSRYWGFVPEDHVVGSPMFVIVSMDEEKGLTKGKIRWNRIFKNANPDKHLWK